MKAIYVLAAIFLTGCSTLMETPEQQLQRISRTTNENNARAVLSDPDPANRAEAARGLGRTGDEASVNLLRQALRDTDSQVRSAAATGLQECGEAGRPAMADVTTAFMAETDPVAAVAMGQALQKWGADLTPGLETLKRVMNQKDQPWARYIAALLIRNMVDVESVATVYVDTLGTKTARDVRNKPEDMLSELIPQHAGVLLPIVAAGAESTNLATRAAVARLLHKFKPVTDPMEVVHRRMEDPNADVFNTVLPPLAEETLLKLLADPVAEVRAAAAWSAGMCSPAPLATVPMLKKLLEDADERVRMEAVGSLGAVAVAPGGPAEAIGLMAEKLSDPSSRVRGDTALALGNMGPLPEDITRQLAARVDPQVEVDANVRAYAVSALGNGADIPALREALARGMADPDPTVVERSRAALERLDVLAPAGE